MMGPRPNTLRFTKSNQIDIESAIHKPDYRHWRKAKQKETSVEFSDWCPVVYYTLMHLLKTFSNQNIMQMLEDNPILRH